MVSKDSVYENLYKLRQLLICEIQNVTGYPLKSAIKSYFYDLEQKVFSLEFKNLVVFAYNFSNLNLIEDWGSPHY